MSEKYHEGLSGGREDAAQHGLRPGAVAAHGRRSRTSRFRFRSSASWRAASPHSRRRSARPAAHRSVSAGRSASLFALIVARRMGQIASAYPTAGGIYHWASMLGGRGYGWAAAWFNLLGLDVRGVVGQLRRVPAVPGPAPAATVLGMDMSTWTSTADVRQGLVDPDALHHRHHGQPGIAQSRRHPRHHHPHRLQRLPDLRRSPIILTLALLFYAPEHRPLAPVHLHQLLRRCRRRRLAGGSASPSSSSSCSACCRACTRSPASTPRPHLGGDAQRRARSAEGHDPLGVLVVPVRLRHDLRVRAGHAERRGRRQAGLERLPLADEPVSHAG